ncbi:MAG: hypothetical protein GF344_18825 [Chitinivibrionales bacterium]|nr:hypothetical protein [Chitinivibrionales bacterium]
MDVAVSLCDALIYSHGFFDTTSKEFIPHGNLSPDFIQISPDGDISIADMGIGDIVKYTYDGSYLIENKNNLFLHPDVKLGKKYQRRHEIYSLGKLILSMLVGYSNFLAYNGDMTMLKRIKNGGNFADINRLGKIIKRLISKRYIPAQDVREMLISYIREEGIRLRKETAAQVVRELSIGSHNFTSKSTKIQSTPAVTHKAMRSAINECITSNEIQADKIRVTESDSFSKTAAGTYPERNANEIERFSEVLGNDPDYSVAFFRLLKSVNHFDQSTIHPFTNLLKREGI